MVERETVCATMNSHISVNNHTFTPFYEPL